MRKTPPVTTLLLACILLSGARCSGVATDLALEPGVTSIQAVQGEGHRSPLVDEAVTVQGTVTAILERPRLHGFWLQDRRSDASVASSGVFVRTKETPPVAVGEAVRVVGRVREYERPRALSLTQIDADEILASSAAPATLEPIRIGDGSLHIPEVFDDDRLESWDPREDAIDFWESLEGMIVEIGHSTVVGPTTRYGDFVILPASEAADTIRTSRGGVLLQDGDENTERIIVDLSLLGDAPALKVGDELEGSFTGIVHYDFGSYRLLATSLPAILERPLSDPPELSSGPGMLSVASYNVLNLSAANEPSRFVSIAGTIVDALGSPVILGLQEIQDDTGGEDDGVVTAEQTLSRLVDAIVEAGGPRYDWRQIDPLNNADGGAPGSNIRVAFLFDPDRIEIIDRGTAGPTTEVSIEGSGNDVHLAVSPARVGTATECFLGEGSSDESEGTRKSLAIEARFGGQTYFLVNNHLKSKRGDDSPSGSVQPPVRHTETQRLCQAERVGSVAREILRRDPDARVIVLGDMNEHQFRPPMEALESSGLVSMIRTVPLEERYTYNYLGNSQVLDHVFVSPSIAGEARAVIPHVNSTVTDGDAASDHDPVLLLIGPAN